VNYSDSSPKKANSSTVSAKCGLTVTYQQINPPPFEAQIDSILARIYDLALLRYYERAAQQQEADSETVKAGGET